MMRIQSIQSYKIIQLPRIGVDERTRKSTKGVEPTVH